MLWGLHNGGTCYGLSLYLPNSWATMSTGAFSVNTVQRCCVHRLSADSISVRCAQYMSTCFVTHQPTYFVHLKTIGHQIGCKSVRMYGMESMKWRLLYRALHSVLDMNWLPWNTAALTQQVCVLVCDYGIFYVILLKMIVSVLNWHINTQVQINQPARFFKAFKWLCSMTKLIKERLKYLLTL